LLLTVCAAFALIVSAPACRGDAPVPRRAMWVWETETILADQGERDRLLAFCRAHQISDVYLQAVYKCDLPAGGEIRCNLGRTDELRSLLHAAVAQRLRIHALDGEPEAVLASEHPRMLALVRALLAFNHRQPTAERLAGIHFDDEPYQLLGFDGPQRDNILTQWLALNQKVRTILAASPEPMLFGIDIPCWIGTADSDGEPPFAVTFDGRRAALIEHLFRFVDYVAVMDYRDVATGSDGIIEHARSLIDSAAGANKRVYVGIETSLSRPARVRFIYGVREAIWQELGRANAPMQLVSQVDGFHIAMLDDDVRRDVGLRVPEGDPDPARLDAALLRLYSIYGATAAGRRDDLGDAPARARQALRREGEYTSFSPREFRLSETELNVAGFETIARMPPKLTFAGKTKAELGDALRQVEASFRERSGFEGIAIDSYSSYREMPD
jgi:hypothetical protein